MNIENANENVNVCHGRFINMFTYFINNKMCSSKIKQISKVQNV